MGTSIWPSVLAFVAVVAAIPFALALLKRAQNIRPARQGPLNLVAGLAVGPRERIAVVETGGRWLVVGITAQSISLLATLDEAPAGIGGSADTPGPASAFARILSSAGSSKDVPPSR